jgi:outer membrane protein assembly factor BamB
LLDRELLRVLRPGGKAILGKQEIVKPFPENTDDWSHPYHGPDNNPQSLDRVARAPYLTHFLAEPWYCPMPLQTVASGGRLFKAFGHIAVKEREWPLLNTLICQNAFNGTILWERKLSPNFMIHRSTMIATPETLYLGDDVSCKLLDAVTGELKREIALKEDGPVWKWMALVDGVLYALVGKDETPDPTVKGDRKARGWPWGGTALGKGYNSKDYPWGFGQTVLAVDPATGKVLWRHKEEEPLDTRAMCMAAGRIFFFSHNKFLAALDAKTGKELWRTTDKDTLAAVGEHKFAQNPTEGFSTSAYVKCNDKGLYFAGPTRADLSAVSAKDGKLLWQKAKAGNSQLVLREDGLYAMSPGQSNRFDYLTGDLLGQLGPRINCTRATGSVDSIFVRGGRDGTVRYDLSSSKSQHICPMRPSCQDGVLVAHGHLFWGPWMCDCNLTLVGVVSVAPAGSFDFSGKVSEADRLEASAGGVARRLEALTITPDDWPTLRADNERRSTSRVRVPGKVKALWTHEPRSKTSATAATTAGGLVFAGSHDGSFHAIDAVSGKDQWTYHTGGAILYPPALAQDRAYVGSSDGWIYCFEAMTGRLLWRFRAAPVERIIPVYGSLASTWPVASGVLVADGVVYAAAGLANHDGTHVYALDAKTGKLIWHNNSSGSLHPTNASGVSVNGHLLLHGGKLHLAGGNMVPVASYNLTDGKCTTDPTAPQSHTQFKAGSDLFVVGDQVVAAGSPLYSSRGDYRMVSQALLQTTAGDVSLSYGPHDSRVSLFPAKTSTVPMAKPTWTQRPLNRVMGLAITANAIVLAGVKDGAKQADSATYHVAALSLTDGATLWSETLPAAPAPWGVAVDRAGRVVVSLEDGRIVCLGAE